MSQSIKKDTINGSKWTIIEKISLQGIQFIIGLILARLLSPSDFGVIGMLTVFIIISQTFVDGGFSNALIRKIDRTETDYSTAFFFNIIIGIICCMILCLIAPFIADFFNIPILSNVLKVLSLTLLINSFAVVQIAKLTINIDFKSQAQATLISVILSGCIGITLAYKNYGVWALVWQSVLSALFKVILIWYFAKWKPLMIFSWKSFRDLFSYGSKLLISNLIGTLYSEMTTIVIGRFYTSKDLGYYSRGQQFAHLPSTAVIDTLGRVTFPILAKIQNEDERLLNVYRKYIRMTSMVIFFLLMLLASVAKPLIILLLTDKWLDSVIFLQIFCFAFMFEHISKLNLNLLQVKGRSDLYLRLEIIKKIIAFAILIISIPWGVIAICLTKVLYGQIALLINTYYTGQLFQFGYWNQFKDFFKYLIYSLFACMPSYILSFMNYSPWIQLSLGGIISIILYCSLLQKDTCFNEIKELVTKKIKKL